MLGGTRRLLHLQNSENWTSGSSASFRRMGRLEGAREPNFGASTLTEMLKGATSEGSSGVVAASILGVGSEMGQLCSAWICRHYSESDTMPTEVPITEPMPRHRPSQPAVQLSLFT